MSHAFRSDGAISPDQGTGRRLFSEEAWAQLGPLLRLSPRELEIVQLVFDEYAEGQIAEALSISSHTVHTHIDRVYRKLGVRTRAGLVIRVCGAHLAGSREPN